MPVAEGAAHLAFDQVQTLFKEGIIPSPVETEAKLSNVIHRGLNCGPVGESNILSINFGNESPELALVVVEAATESFMSFWVKSKQNPLALEYYNEQIETIEAEIGKLLVQRAEIHTKEGLGANRTNNSAGIQQMRQMEYSYFQARSVREGLQDRVESTMSAIEADNTYMPSMSQSGARDGLMGMKANWNEAQLELARLQMSYQDSSVYISRQLEYVEKTWLLFKEARDDFIDDMNIELDMARAKESSLGEALAEYQEGLSKFPELEKAIASLDLKINTRTDLLEAVQIKRGEVRLKAESDQRISNITRLNQPAVDDRITGNKKFIYLILAGGLAFVLGLVVALLVDAQDHRIFDRRQAESALDLPVLGVISASKASSRKR